MILVKVQPEDSIFVNCCRKSRIGRHFIPRLCVGILVLILPTSEISNAISYGIVHWRSPVGRAIMITDHYGSLGRTY